MKSAIFRRKSMDIFTTMKERRSTRVYLDKPVTRKEVEQVFQLAGLAPSAMNLQPWEFVVTYGEEKDRLVRNLKKVQAERKVTCGPGTTKPLPEKFAGRSRKVLQLMEPGIAETGISYSQFIEQGGCSFYGAPIAIIVTMDQLFPEVRYLDVGLSVSYLLLAAHAMGLGTCPIGLIIPFADVIADTLDIQENKRILLAISMGHPDNESPVNKVKTNREELPEILSWHE